MKTKIIGIFVCTLLLTTILSVSGTKNFDEIKTVEKNDDSGGCPCDSFLETRGPLSPDLEWYWDGTGAWNNYSNRVMTTPLVADLDNNPNNIPNIVFITFENRSYFKGGVLRAVYGTGGSYFDVKNNNFCPASTPAIGDIDNDGLPEIIVLGEAADNITSHYLFAYENNGAYKWHSTGNATAMNCCSAPAIADLNNDGTPEIIVGDIVFRNDGLLLSVGGQGNGRGISCIADIDLDGVPEVIAGNTVYKYSTSGGLSVKWKNTSLPVEGLNAIGNFDNDPEAEIVLVNHSSSNAQVYLLNHDLTEIWHKNLNNIGGGPPTIDDYDGDGYPEIGFSTEKNYSVFDRQGNILWNKTIRDDSSGATGSTVFDLNADGVKEVLYSDEDNLRIWDGRNGNLLWSKVNPSGTVYEMPVVADVDSDGHAEFVVARNTYHSVGDGIRVFGNSTWASARGIWNQHTYHITNIYDNALVPSPEVNNWQCYNNYRVQSPNSSSICCYKVTFPKISFLKIVANVTEICNKSSEFNYTIQATWDKTARCWWKPYNSIPIQVTSPAIWDSNAGIIALGNTKIYSGFFVGRGSINITVWVDNCPPVQKKAKLFGPFLFYL